MKNLKKFVALLLAGVMAMVLLTACGGGNGTVIDTTKQETAFDTIRGKSSQVNQARVTENDRELQAIAEKYLNQDLNSSIDFLGAQWVAGFHVDGKGTEYLTITATSSYKAGVLVTAMLDTLQTWVGGKELPDTNVDLNAKGSWRKIGFVVKTNPTTKQSYMAVTFRIVNPSYGKK